MAQPQLGTISIRPHTVSAAMHMPTSASDWESTASIGWIRNKVHSKQANPLKHEIRQHGWTILYINVHIYNHIYINE